MELKNSEAMPTEIASIVQNLEKSIQEMEESVSKLTSTPLNDAHTHLKPLDRAKYDTASVYCVTSLYWAFLRTKGSDPKAHGMMKELDRVKEAVGRAKQISDRALAPKVDVSAVKRIIKHGLWETTREKTSETIPADGNLSENPSPSKKQCIEISS